MAFKASQFSLQQGFAQALDVAQQEKRTLQGWYTQLGGNITGMDAVAMLSNLSRVLGIFSTIAALPGLSDYAKTQFADTNYNVGTEFTAMVNALTAIQTWLKTNVPANGVTIVDGALVGTTYTPAQTAALRALVNSAIATID